MRTIFIVLLTLVVSGCATTGHYGSFLPEDKNDIEIRIVHDAVDQLIELYPPAKSRLNLKHEASGQFGVTLVRILRKEGYAVKEYDKTKGEIGESDKDGFSLRYVLDVAGTPDFY
ncbi:MAG: hypothetical protein KZQ97_14075, partial [Candidatus Thiodiazotropha sp. (ex Dulcina madagascariensis)]|nr:hypothetical protein [Candidatus Thiodiazotropha sp. (ex Dulcina madagascariensis)]